MNCCWSKARAALGFISWEPSLEPTSLVIHTIVTETSQSRTKKWTDSLTNISTQLKWQKHFFPHLVLLFLFPQSFHPNISCYTGTTVAQWPTEKKPKKQCDDPTVYPLCTYWDCYSTPLCLSQNMICNRRNNCLACWGLSAETWPI